MADLFPVAGAKIYIGDDAMTVPSADVSESTFSGVSWTQIKDWETMGAIGDASSEITTDLIDRGRTVVQKGTKRSPTMSTQFAVNATDAGQLALIAAEATHNNYPFKIVFDDAPDGGTPTSKYFVGLVMSAQEQGGSANTTRMLSADIAPNTNIVTVAAAA